MKKLYFFFLAMMAIVNIADAQLSITSQFINPCGNDGSNEFTVAKTGLNAVNIADVIIGSYNPSSNGSGVGGTARMDYNYWWRGNRAVSTPYPTFSPDSVELCGTQDLNCYGFRYPSVPADASDITALIDTLNNIAGCTVFLTVPPTDIIPANSNVIFFLGAGYRSPTGLCGFNNATTNLNFSNHCSNGIPVATYYVVFGNGNGAGANCTNPGGYFSNTNRRISALHTFTGGDSLNAANYVSSFQDYDPGSSGSTGNAGIIVPNGSGGTTWINNQGCIPAPSTVLAIRLDYFTAVLIQNKKGLVKWRSSFEEGIKDFIIEKSFNGKDFFPIKHTTPKNISGSEYSIEDEALATGTNFYRLKVINLDGTVDYSAIVKINLKKGTPSNWYVYPNPAKADALIMYQTTTAKNITVNVTDVAGKLISTTAHNITPGNNKISIPSHRMSSGMYIITIFNEGQKETSSFIKQ